MKGTSKRRRRAKRDAGAVDEVAASIILRTYLATRRVSQAGSHET